MHPTPRPLTAALCALLLSAAALTPRAAHAKQGSVEVPIEVGVGPALHFVTNDTLSEQQTFYTGLRLNLEAIITKELIKRFEKKIPKKYRKMVKNIDEAKMRVKEMMLIPRTLLISPTAMSDNGQSGMYGAMWDFMGIGIGLGPLSVSANVQATYAYISYLDSDPLKTPKSMHFLRPGLTASAEIPLRLNDTVGVTAGWRSTVYLPQELGGGVTAMKFSREGTIWHIGQAFITLDIRFPYTTTL